MKGLEQILKKIEDDSTCEADRIIADAKKTAEKIIADAREKADKEAQKIIADADKKTSLMLETAKNSCASLIKRSEASAKAEIVADCIKIAGDDINSMSDEEYFEVLKKLILKYSHPDVQGELLMDKSDVSKMPKHFLNELKKAGADLILCENSVDVGKGFILRYGGVEENCTFNSLIEEKTDEIKDKLYLKLREV